ncbi:OmpW/AlkL family protein [Agaribacter flavus]|uniref:OmpW family protein n=1 Tax=Agaribacter flavus TaxID=1902781 RepID=A0ABV7FLF4_9ALTE
MRFFYLVRFTLLIPFTLFIGVASAYANQSDFNWSFDAGFLHLSPNDSSSEISGPGLPPGNAVDVGSSSSVFGSLTYYYNENWSSKIYLAPFMDFDVYAAGSLTGVGQIASVEALFPTVFVNYTHTSLWKGVHPYIGVGLNYTLFDDEQPTAILNGALGGETTVSLDSSVGLAAQLGLKVKLSPQWYLDIGYVYIDVDTTANLSTAAVNTQRSVDVSVDPAGTYLKFGYRF